MASKNSREKTTSRTKESATSKFKLHYEYNDPKNFISPSAGKPQPWNIRAHRAVVEFFRDVILAIKSIIMEVM